uniref:Uncharacterized protein n=1 Tax=Romanomermis culicivorax TaxID=13658 RepID=A0A915KW70_ROMCU
MACKSRLAQGDTGFFPREGVSAIGLFWGDHDEKFIEPTIVYQSNGHSDLEMLPLMIYRFNMATILSMATPFGLWMQKIPFRSLKACEALAYTIMKGACNEY